VEGGVASTATADDVARLFGRAAFGATKTDLTNWTGKDYAAMVESLFPTTTSLPSLPDEPRRKQLESATTDLLAVQRWWLNRMATTPTPFLERMTLFWHTHFATGYTGDVTAGDLIVQNQTIRANALGDFRQLAYQLTIDPGMLVWLSGIQNRVNAVNENYGRELLELFVCGTKPQVYTETDIRQAAKALTGWTINSNRKATFTSGRHDRTVKHVLGATIGGYPANDAREATEYQEVVNAALNASTTATFLAYKMVCSFAYVPASTDLVANPDPLVSAVAAALRPATPSGVWDIAAGMRTLLLHDAFRYPDRAGGKGLVRSPIEITVHMSKPMGVNLDPLGGINNTSAYANNVPIVALRRTGQVPFQPPNVGGWPKGTQWLSAITTQARYDLGQYMLTPYGSQNRKTTNPLPASTDTAGWTSFLGLGSLSPLTQSRLSSYLASPGTSDEATKQTSVLLLLSSSPDWQVM
jgi:uncharacterized protein (DUF1800 family)